MTGGRAADGAFESEPGERDPDRGGGSRDGDGGRIRVVLVDDQELFRAGLAMLVESQPDMELAGQAGDGERAVAVVREASADVVLMDLRMPVLDGLGATRRILAENPHGPRVVVLTTFRHDEHVVRAIRAGASGFLLKDANPEFVLAAIRTVHEGQAVIAPAATMDLLRHFGSGAPVAGGGASVAPARPAVDVETLLGPLSPREREIFLLAAKGLSNAEIATSAFVAETTVKSHMRSVLGKLELRDRVQLVVFAHEKGLVR